ncbi:unnamed protein product [Zymoseptoria tritici ST99CH_3D7]|uniref:Urea active transporter n=1 Tax=Zymoseptoria tritici (strain ST99CH_3D7) TaxID=1276538 RepID=A0A1X7RP46_ZYMT9|nr:unnamed protein product [Zymoseptoria tritici ST99CH_3D7]
MSDADVTAGLVLPNTAVAVLGRGRAVATLLLAFMAIMSTYSSELISVSSIATYDIYKMYVRPNAPGKALMRMNYIVMSIFALFMAGFATMLYYIGVSMGYLYLLMGVMLSSCVIPATLTLLWADQSWAAATLSPPLGFICSVTSWRVTTQVTYGELTMETTGLNTPMLVGNVVALLSPLISIPILTYVPPFKPQRYDWQSMLDIRVTTDDDPIVAADVDTEKFVGESAPPAPTPGQGLQEKAKLDKMAKLARWLCICLALCLLIVWPMPLFGSGYIFSVKFFTGWVVVGIIWLFVSCTMVVFLPLLESRKTIVRTSRAILKDLMGIGQARAGVVEGEVAPGSGMMTPVEGLEKVGGKDVR